MKLLGYLAVFLLSAVGMFVGLSRRQQNDGLNPSSGVADTTTDERSWDQKNRGRVDSVFFIEVPAWIRGSQGKATPGLGSAPSEAGSSGVQSNPFSQ